MNQILIVGAGAFGIALAASLQTKQNNIHFLARNRERFEEYQNTTSRPLQIKSFQTFDEFTGNLKEYDLVIFAIPTQSLRPVLTHLKAQFHSYCEMHKSGNNSNKLLFISTSKGIEADSMKLPHQIFYDVWEKETISVAALSGPSSAKEMLQQLPTCLTLASEDTTLIQKAISIMHSPYFRLYDSPDIIGVEIGGALKNVVALLAGMSDGLAQGHNAQAAIITLGLSDIAHIGVRMGASPFTFMGLSGLGDLILTCTVNLSRNRQFGLRFARGESKEHIIAQMGGVIEGIITAKSAYQLMKSLGISSLLLSASYQILYENVSLQDMMHKIINEKQGSEFCWLKQVS